MGWLAHLNCARVLYAVVTAVCLHILPLYTCSPLAAAAAGTTPVSTLDSTISLELCLTEAQQPGIVCSAGAACSAASRTRSAAGSGCESAGAGSSTAGAPA
jgi:hypothetical protein